MNERAFYAVLSDWRARPYNFADANCCQFAADVARCSGADIEVPACEDADAAAAWIQERGCKSLYHYLVKLFGRPVAPLQGRRGWIVYRKGEGLEGSAIGTIDRKALFVGPRGLVEVPLSQCAAVFNPGKWRSRTAG